MWLGDYPEDHTTVTCLFTSHSSTGAPVAPNSAFEAADVVIFKNGSATEKTTTNGVTMTSPFNSTTGLHCVVIDTSNDTGDGGFWVTGAVYTLVLVPDETVDGVAVTRVIGQFGIELYGALRPTTAGRKLDVTTGGEAGIDWANIGSPTTTQNLSGTTVKTATDVETDTQDIQSRLPAALGANGNIKADVRDFNGTAGTFASGRPEVNVSHFGGSAGTFSSGRPEVNASHISGSSTAADNVEVVYATDFATNYNTTRDKWQVEADVTAISGDSTAADNCEAAFDGNTYNVGGGAIVAASVTGAVGSVTGAVGSVSGNVGGNVTGSIGSLATQAKADVNAEVDTALAEINLDHLVKSAVDTDFATTVHLNSVVGQLADNGTTATFDRATDSLEAIRDRGDAAWITGSTHSAADVWAVATRVLTAGTNIVLAKGTGITGFNDLSAAQVNTEADTALADAGVTTTVTGRIDAAISTRASQASVDTIDDFVDTEVAAIKAKTDNLPSDPADQSLIIAATDALAAAISALTIPTANQNADAWLDRADAIEVGLTPRQAMRLVSAISAGKLSGAATTTNTIRNAVADSKNRIVATVDADGNRSAVTVDLS